jgi:hypothetical protein
MMLREMFDSLPADLQRVDVIREACGVPTSRRSSWPGLVAAKVADGDNLADAVAAVAKSEHISERVVRQALDRAERNPAVRKAQAVWQANDHGEWHVVWRRIETNAGTNGIDESASAGWAGTSPGLVSGDVESTFDQRR